jgi:hypothetical protein
MDLEKHGPRDNLLSGGNRGIETLDVADLKDAVAALGRGDQSVGLAESCRDGLLDENVETGIEEHAAEAGMFVCGRGEADGVDMFRDERVHIANDARAEFGGDLLGASGIFVDDACELDGTREFAIVCQLAPNANVVASEFADADDCYAYGFVRHCLALPKFFLVAYWTTHFRRGDPSDILFGCPQDDSEYFRRPPRD